MDGVSADASVLTILGVTGRLVFISSNLWEAAEDIKSTDKEINNIKVEVENLVPVFNFAGSVLKQWQPHIELSDAEEQRPKQFYDECGTLCEELKNLAEEQRKTRFEKVMQRISLDRKRRARLNVLKSRLESVKATLNLSMTAMHLQQTQHSEIETAINPSQGAEDQFQKFSEIFSSVLEQQKETNKELQKALKESSFAAPWEDNRCSTLSVQSEDKTTQDQEHITEGIFKSVARRSLEVFPNTDSAQDDKALSRDCTVNLDYSPVRIVYVSPQTGLSGPGNVSNLTANGECEELVAYKPNESVSEVSCPTCQGSAKTCDCHFRRWAKQESPWCLVDQGANQMSNLALPAYLCQCIQKLEFQEKFESAGWVVVAIFGTSFVYIDLLAQGPEKSYFFRHPILEPKTQATVPGWSRVENRFGRVYYQHRDTGLIMYQHPSTSEKIDPITGCPDQYLASLPDTRLSLDDPLGPCQLSRSLFSRDRQMHHIRYSHRQWAQAVGVNQRSSTQSTFVELPRRVLSEQANSQYEAMFGKPTETWTQHIPNIIDVLRGAVMTGMVHPGLLGS